MDLQQWSPPPAGFKKLNFDAAYANMQAYVGIVLRDEFGTIITAWNGRFTASSPFAVEAEAALQAFKLGEKCDFHNIIFEGDAMNVINA